MKKGYKVVRCKNDKYWSAYYPTDPKQYFVGEKTERSPEFGPLCVFSGLWEAKRYKEAFEKLKGTSEYFSFELYSCEYKKSRLKRIWNPSSSKTYSTVSGTELAEWVILKEKIL